MNRANSDKQIIDLKNKIAKQFLINLKRFGTVVLLTNKPAFEEAVKKLEAKVKEFQESVKKGLDEEIRSNKQLLIDALLPSVQANPPTRWNKYVGTSPLKDHLRKMLDDELTSAFGTAKSIVSDMKVSVIFKGITYELLNN